jgi:hypothetical protein
VGEHLDEREAEHVSAFRGGVEASHPGEDVGGGGVWEVVDQPAVGQEQGPVGVGGGGGAVGDHDDGLAEVVRGVAEEGQQRLAVAGVEVAGGFVGEHDLGPGDQRAGGGDPLLLAAGQLARAVVEPSPRPRVSTNVSRHAGSGRRPASVSGSAMFSAAVSAAPG